MTRAELVFRAVRHVRGGLGPAESGIYEDNASLLVPNALYALAARIAADEARRGLLRKTWTGLAVTNGVIAFGAITNLLTLGLCWGQLYDADDTSRVAPYVFKRNWSDLDRWLNPVYGYFAVRGQEIVTRKRGTESISDGKVGFPGPAVLVASYVPANDLADLPGELDDDAVSELSNLLAMSRANGGAAA